MILLKDFFRKKSSKIFILIFVFIVFTIEVVFNFKSYYENFITNSYNETTYFLLKSDKDLYTTLSSNNKIKNIEKVILFENSKEEITNINKMIFLDPENNNIIVKQKSKLKDNESIIEVSPEMLNNEKIEKIDFVYNDEIIKLDIVKLEKSTFSRVYISESKFKELSNKSEQYSYIFNINDYKRMNSLASDLKKEKSINDVSLIHAYQKTNAIETVLKYEKVLDLLNKGLLVVGIVFCGIYILMLKNIINDEVDNMKIEKLIGFSKKQIIKSLLLKVILSNIISIIIATILNVITNVILNTINVRLDIFNVNMFTCIVLFSIFVTCFLSASKLLNKKMTY